MQINNKLLPFAKYCHNRYDRRRNLYTCGTQSFRVHIPVQPSQLPDTGHGDHVCQQTDAKMPTLLPRSN